jgi:hypothetical protein
VEFWSDPDVSAELLPRGVELDARSGGRCVAVFGDCQFTANRQEYLDPARYQSREFLVLVDTTWQGSQIGWCPYAYTDNDASIMMGRVTQKSSVPSVRPAPLLPAVQRRRRSPATAHLPVVYLPMASRWQRPV